MAWVERCVSIGQIQIGSGIPREHKAEKRPTLDRAVLGDRVETAMEQNAGHAQGRG